MLVYNDDINVSYFSLTFVVVGRSVCKSKSTEHYWWVSDTLPQILKYSEMKLTVIAMTGRIEFRALCQVQQVQVRIPLSVQIGKKRLNIITPIETPGNLFENDSNFINEAVNKVYNCEQNWNLIVSFNMCVFIQHQSKNFIKSSLTVFDQRKLTTLKRKLYNLFVFSTEYNVKF